MLCVRSRSTRTRLLVLLARVDNIRSAGRHDSACLTTEDLRAFLHAERAAQSVEAEKEDEKAGADLPVIFGVSDYGDGQPNPPKNQRHNANGNYYAHRESSSVVGAVVIVIGAIYADNCDKRGDEDNAGVPKHF